MSVLVCQRNLVVQKWQKVNYQGNDHGNDLLKMVILARTGLSAYSSGTDLAACVRAGLSVYFGSTEPVVMIITTIKMS